MRALVRDCAPQQDRVYWTKYCIALNAGGMPSQYCRSTVGPECLDPGVFYRVVSIALLSVTRLDSPCASDV